MRKLGIIGIILLVLAPFLGANTLEKEAIVKLINQNKLLNKKVNGITFKLLLLEQQIKLLQVKKVPKTDKNRIVAVKKYKHFTEVKIEPFYYKPKVVSHIRNNHYPYAKALRCALPSQQLKITLLACYSKVGFWGKSNRGWIYISNPKYGDIVSLDGKTMLSQNYNKWCKIKK